MWACKCGGCAAEMWTGGISASAVDGASASDRGLVMFVWA